MALSINNISTSYNRSTILHKISLKSIAKGQFIGLIGPNGSGKSTLLKTLAGVVKQDSGTFIFHETDLFKLPLKKRAQIVAYMPQTVQKNIMLSVFEVLLLALKQSGGLTVQNNHLDSVAEILQVLNIEHLAKRYMFELSGGQAQMVAVAQVMIKKPSLILFDEPTSALDIYHQLWVMQKIKELTRENDTIVICALHDLTLAAEFTDKLVLINQGKILADGDAKEVLELPTISQTYFVQTSVEQTQRGSYFLDARL